MFSLLVAVNAWATLNPLTRGVVDPAGSPPDENENCEGGEPVDMLTGDNLVREEGLRLATPDLPLSFDLHYNSGSEMPGVLGKGWDFSLNWRLSLIYRAYYYNGTGDMKCYGASLEKYPYLASLSYYYLNFLTNGPLSAANANFPLPAPPPLASPVKKDLLDWLFSVETAVADTPSAYSALINKWFIISDGKNKYRVEGGCRTNTTGTLPDWDINGGHYTEMPMDMELVHANNEYRLLLPGKKWMIFDDNGRMSSMGDAWGNTVTRSQTGDNEEKYSNSNGRWLKFTYGTSNLVSEIQTDDGRGMNFAYTNGNLLASVEWYGGGKSRTHCYTYDANKKLVSRVNAEGTVSQYEYGSDGKANSMSMGSPGMGTNWYRHTVAYGPIPQMTFYARETSWNEDFLFDNQGRLGGVGGPWNSTCPQGHQVMYYSYDKWRNIIAERYIEGSNLFIVTNGFGENHRVLESSICNGANTQQLFSAAWSAEDRLPSSITNADGLVINYEYTNGIVGLATFARQGTAETIFEAAEWDHGKPGTMRDARGAETHLTYNTAGQVATVTPPAGPGYGFEYDSAGLVHKVNRLEPGNVTHLLAQYARDGFGQITNATYTDGLSEQFEYDPMRRLTNAVDRAGRTTQVAYWPIGKVKSVTPDANGLAAKVSFDYDEQGTSLKITDEIGRIVEAYALDVNGRATSVTNILGQTLNVTYAIMDKPQAITRFDGSVVNFAYDVAWRPITIQYPDDTVHITYSAGGLLQKITDGSGAISNKYDALLRWAGQTGPHSWDEITAVNGTGGLPASVTSVGGTVSYSYDIGSRLTAIFSPENTFNYSYNPTNGLISGVLCATGGINVSYNFDTFDRLVDISWKDSTNNVVRGFTYGYNVVGMITQKVTVANSLQTTNLYEYDSLDRLTSESSFSPQSSAVSLYQYDLAGNRTQMVSNGQTIRYTLSSANRLTSWGTNGSQQFDLAGNVTNIQYDDGRQLELKWDSRHRVTEVKTNGTLAEKYQYDAFGRRTAISDGASTNYLVYAGVHVVAEVDSTGNLLKSYTYGPGIDNILSMTIYGGTTSTYFYVKDNLGSVMAVTDSTGTNIVESYQYDAWGNVSAFDSLNQPITQSLIGNHFLWQGREISWKSGLYYFRARWYEPVLGRWLSNDPIGISGGLNQYVFCGDDPVNCVDIDGLRVINKSKKRIPIIVNPINPDGTQGKQEIYYLPPGGDTDLLLPGYDTDAIYPVECQGKNKKVLKIVNRVTAEILPSGGVRFPAGENNPIDLLDQAVRGGWKGDDFIKRWQWPIPSK